MPISSAAIAAAHTVAPVRGHLLAGLLGRSRHRAGDGPENSRSYFLRIELHL
jgi:hypothetical protein